MRPSGSATSRVPRALRLWNPDGVFRERSRASSGARRASARKTRDIVKADLPEVLITGCRDTQTSADAFINGRYNGALTFALVEAMRKGKAALTYKQLHDRAAVVLKTRKFDQVPQLEGRTDRFDTPLFSA